MKRVFKIPSTEQCRYYEMSIASGHLLGFQLSRP